MSDTVISVENLGKKYIIGHQRAEGYATLRDTLTTNAKNLLKPFQRSKSQAVATNFEDFWALKDISFDIKQGDRVGIIGRNGAGKSTLLKILSRIVEPTKGSVRIKGRVASLLEVGTGFHPELTGRENITLNGAILGMSKVEVARKFDEIVAFAEVEKFLDTPVKRYSSGMYVRLAFAVAAHLEPEILIVDEVLAVGDAKFQKKCLGKMQDVAEEGRTIIFVSHNMESLMRLCDTGVLLKNGSVEFSGSLDRAATYYLKSDFGVTSRRRWDDSSRAPSSDVVRLEEVYVHQEDGEILDTFNITGSIGVTMIYDVIKDGEVFTHSMNVYNENGVHILSSHDVNSQFRDRVRSKGRYSSTMWIPGNFLSEGSITVSVAILEPDPFLIHFHEYDVVAFRVVDPLDGNSARGNCTLNFPGVVRPLLNWESQKIG
jgi:lipopolysaccharide transport system ATP-binding protein